MIAEGKSLTKFFFLSQLVNCAAPSAQLAIQHDCDDEP